VEQVTAAKCQKRTQLIVSAQAQTRLSRNMRFRFAQVQQLEGTATAVQTFVTYSATDGRAEAAGCRPDQSER
jgi:alpha-amylase/alpha-mannosidase (GH57 family)